MRIILSLQTEDHRTSPQQSLQRTSVASGGVGGMFTRGWEAEYPTDDSSEESESSSAYGDGHYRLAPRSRSRSVTSPAATRAGMTQAVGGAQVESAPFYTDALSPTGTEGPSTLRGSASPDPSQRRATKDANDAERENKALQQHKTYAGKTDSPILSCH